MIYDANVWRMMADALDKLKLHGLAFNLVVTDLRMGTNPDGLTVIQEAQKANPRIKAFLVTGDVDCHNLITEAVKKLGAKVLFKPFTLESFRDAVETAVRET